MKKAVLLHGMSGSLDRSFGIKLKDDLKNLGFEIVEPLFTVKKDITLDSWFKTADQIKQDILEASVIICHSLGTNFIIKYLTKNNISSPLVIAVAGGIATEHMGENFDYLEPFVPTDDECKKFTKLVRNVYNIYSNNDHIWKQENIHNYSSLTHAKEIFIKDKGHFGETSNVKEIPEIIQIIKENYNY